MTSFFNKRIYKNYNDRNGWELSDDEDKKNYLLNLGFLLN